MVHDLLTLQVHLSSLSTDFLLLGSCCLAVIPVAPLVVHALLTLQEHLSSLRVFIAVFVLFNSYTDCSTSDTEYTDPSGTFEFTTGFCCCVRVA